MAILFFGTLLLLNLNASPATPSPWAHASISLQVDCPRHGITVIGDNLGHHTDSWGEVTIAWQAHNAQELSYLKGHWYDGRGIPYQDADREPIAFLPVTGAVDVPVLVTASLYDNPAERGATIYDCSAAWSGPTRSTAEPKGYNLLSSDEHGGSRSSIDNAGQVDGVAAGTQSVETHSKRIIELSAI